VDLAAQPICSIFHVIANTCLIDLYPASAVGLCLMIYKLEKLSDQQFEAKLLPSSPSGNSELKPPPPPPPLHLFTTPLHPLLSKHLSI